MLSIACKHFTDIGKKLLSTPCTQMVITAIYLYTHTHTHTPSRARVGRGYSADPERRR